MTEKSVNFVAPHGSIGGTKAAALEFIIRENGLLSAFSALTSLQRPDSGTQPSLYKLSLSMPRGVEPVSFMTSLVKHVNTTVFADSKVRASFVAPSTSSAATGDGSAYAYTQRFYALYIGPYDARVELATLSPFPSMPYLADDVPLEDITWAVPVRVNGATHAPLQLLPTLLEQTLRDARCARIADDIRATVLGIGPKPLGVQLPWAKLAKLAPLLPAGATHLMPPSVTIASTTRGIRKDPSAAPGMYSTVAQTSAFEPEQAPVKTWATVAARAAGSATAATPVSSKQQHGLPAGVELLDGPGPTTQIPRDSKYSAVYGNAAAAADDEEEPEEASSSTSAARLFYAGQTASNDTMQPGGIFSAPVHYGSLPVNGSGGSVPRATVGVLPGAVAYGGGTGFFDGTSLPAGIDAHLEALKHSVSVACWTATAQLAEALMCYDKLPYIAVACPYELDMRALANLHTLAQQLRSSSTHISAIDAFVLASVRAPMLRPGLWTLLMLPLMLLSTNMQYVHPLMKSSATA
jgi:hypothetical protein